VIYCADAVATTVHGVGMRLLAGLSLAALVTGGCGHVCDADVPRPAPACVRFAVSGQAFLMVLTPECGLVDTDVQVVSNFSGASWHVHVDEAGRSQALSIETGFSPEELELRFQVDGCPERLCVHVGGAGPGAECTLQAEPG
jgi:hypothetical protein